MLEQREAEANQKKYLERSKADKEAREKLEALKNRFYILSDSTDYANRGYELERILYDLFMLSNLGAKTSYRMQGEQIDGAFILDNTEFLFEAKWVKQPIGVADLDSFSSKVVRNLDNTLGLFLSVNGFSDDGIHAHSRGGNRPKIILMDGRDLSGVLERRIELIELLRKKKAHAARTGKILLPLHMII